MKSMKIIVNIYIPDLDNELLKKECIKHITIIKSNSKLKNIFNFYFVHNFEGKNTEYRTFDSDEIYYTDFYDSSVYKETNSAKAYTTLSFFKYIKNLNINEDYYIVNTSTFSVLNYKKLYTWLEDKPRKCFVSASIHLNNIYANNLIISNDLMIYVANNYERSVLHKQVVNRNITDTTALSLYCINATFDKIFIIDLRSIVHGDDIEYHKTCINDNNIFCFTITHFGKFHDIICENIYNPKFNYVEVLKYISKLRNCNIKQVGVVSNGIYNIKNRESSYEDRNMAIFIVGRIKGYEINKNHIEEFVKELNKQKISPYFFISLNTKRDDYHIEFEDFVKNVSNNKCEFNYEEFVLPEHLKEDYNTMYNTVSMHYNNNVCLRMIDEYMKKNNFVFDIVMKWRTEINYDMFFDFYSKLEDITIYVPNIHYHGGINDQVAYGNYESMCIYANLYNNLLKYKHIRKHPETLFNAYIREHLSYRNFSFLYELVKD